MRIFKHSKSTQSNNFAISLQYLKKEVRNGVHLLHADKHQSFYKLRLSFLTEVARHVQSTENRKLVIYLHYIKKNVSRLLLCSIVMENIQMFYRGPAMFNVTCFLAQTGCGNVLSDHCNTIIIQQLCGENLPSLLPLLQVDAFLLTVLSACIRPCYAKTSTHSLTRTYCHTATESPKRLCGLKTSWTPTLMKKLIDI